MGVVVGGGEKGEGGECYCSDVNGALCLRAYRPKEARAIMIPNAFSVLSAGGAFGTIFLYVLGHDTYAALHLSCISLAFSE